MLTATIEAVKAYFDATEKLREEYQGAKERHLMKQSRLTAARTSQLDGLPHSGGQYDGIQRLLESVEEAGSKADRLLKLLKARQVEVEELAVKLERCGERGCEEMAELLRLRYIRGLSATAAIMRMYGVEPGQREWSKYHRRFYRRQERAFELLAILAAKYF